MGRKGMINLKLAEQWQAVDERFPKPTTAYTATHYLNCTYALIKEHVHIDFDGKPGIR